MSRLRFPNQTGWLAVLDTIHGLEATHTRGLDAARARPAAGNDAEFVVALRGFPMDQRTRARVEKVIRRTVLEKLAEVDALGDVTVTSVSALFAGLRRSLPRGTSTLGLVVEDNASRNA